MSRWRPSSSSPPCSALPATEMQAPPDGGSITLSAAKYAALRQSLAAAILKARTEAGAEALRWRAEAEAARAEADALRERLAQDLALERAAPLSLPAAVTKVAAACQPLDRNADADARHASFLRQGAATARGDYARAGPLTRRIFSAHRADGARGVRRKRFNQGAGGERRRPLAATRRGRAAGGAAHFHGARYSRAASLQSALCVGKRKSSTYLTRALSSRLRPARCRQSTCWRSKTPPSASSPLRPRAMRSAQRASDCAMPRWHSTMEALRRTAAPACAARCAAWRNAAACAVRRLCSQPRPRRCAVLRSVALQHALMARPRAHGRSPRCSGYTKIRTTCSAWWKPP